MERDNKKTLMAISPYSLPVNATQNGLTAEQIKEKFWKGLFYLYDLTEEEKNTIATRLDEFNDGEDSIEDVISGILTDLETRALKSNTYTKDEVDGKDASALASAKTYSDGNLNTAKGYTDSIDGARKTYVDGQIVAAKSYADGKDATRKTYVDNEISGAKTYANNVPTTKTYNGLDTLEKTLVGAINENKARIDNVGVTVTFDNYSAMVSAFNGTEYDNKLKANDNINFRAFGIPDLWVNEKKTTKTSYTYTNDSAIVDTLATDGKIQIGYFELSAQESDIKSQIKETLHNKVSATSLDSEATPTVSYDKNTGNLVFGIPKSQGITTFSIDANGHLIVTGENASNYSIDSNGYLIYSSSGVNVSLGQVKYIEPTNTEIDSMLEEVFG